MIQHRSIRALAAFALLGIAGTGVHAQTVLDLPRASQQASVSQRIGLTEIAIRYCRPLVNARTIWGKLCPYGDVWRAGANENTTISFGDDVTVDGKPLPKGTYGLHMIPTEGEWTVIFSKTSTAWGSFTYAAAGASVDYKAGLERLVKRLEAKEDINK